MVTEQATAVVVGSRTRFGKWTPPSAIGCVDMIDGSTNGLAVVISGSFRKHYDDIRETIKGFESLGVNVLSPKHSDVVNPGEEFVLLESDGNACPERIEREHLAAICRADALYLCNKEGYIGPSSAMELGWALAMGKPVYTKEPCKDAALQHFVGRAATPNEVKADLLERRPDTVQSLGWQASLKVLQSYIREVGIERGFDSETPRDKVLLMLEEFGELAKALRKYIGLKIDEDRKEHYTELRYELADILIYLLDLANACGIDLFDAFQEKERRNANRRWGKA